MSRRRQERVTELIHQEISKLVLNLKDPGLGFITILAVRLTPDFMQARVFYSVLGSEDDIARTEAALKRAQPYIRSQLRSLESLKFPPEITFVLDHSAEEAQKVLDILSQLKTGQSPAPIPSPQTRSPKSRRKQ